MAKKVDIKDFVALVTGASSGIGSACCLALARKGCHIAALGLKEEKLKRVTDECKKHGVNAVAIATELHSRESIQGAVDRCVHELGGLNILVNAAGKMVMTDGSLDQWENCLDVNLKSLMAITNLAVPHLEKKEGGAVINVASTAGRHASGHVVPYCASKFGVVGFSLSLFEMLRGRGIRVCTINPGYVDLPMAHGIGPENLAHTKKIQAQDVAHTVVFAAKFPISGCLKEISLSPMGK